MTFPTAPSGQMAEPVFLVDPATNLPSTAGGIFNTGSTTALAASATYTGSSRDVGVAAGTVQPFAFFNGFFASDQAGVAYLDGSNDNSTWFTCATSPLLAGTPLTLSVPVMFRYHRARLVNGVTAQSTFVSNDAYTAG